MASNSKALLNEINESLQKLSKEPTLEAGIEVANRVLALLTPEALNAPSDVIDDRLVALPNAERQDHWFMKHPWMGAERAAFDILDSETVPIQGKFYWMKKRSRQYVSGGVHLTENWEDHDFTRNDAYKIGVDFFLDSAATSVFVVVSNRGNLRLVEIKNRLTNTQIEIFSKWAELQGMKSCEQIHGTLWESFRLQSVNNSFYLGVANSFNELLQHLTSAGKDEESSKLFASRLLGRIMFTWFVRNMGLIHEAVGYFDHEDLDSTSYYKKRLEPLFFETLNTPIELRGLGGDVGQSSSLEIDLVTPYLNGGLFEPHENDWYGDDLLSFPAGFFDRLFEHFSNYNFTTDESTPEYEQVAIDPEMLGRVFESLLATQIDDTGEQARKAMGAFYTPREIVAYMCRETVRQSLKAKFADDHVLEKAIDVLLDTSDREWAVNGTNSIRYALPLDRRSEVIEALNNLTVLDPACGSGAFPMGMVSLLSKLHERLDPTGNKHDTKLRIMQNNIFGVDIEPMAVEISRLRAWLSIIVEKDATKSVEPLPNLDFKFVCANSLVHLANAADDLGLFADVGLADSLAEIRSTYFSATDSDVKTKLRHQYEELTQSEHSYMDDVRTQQVKSFKPFEYEHPAGFFDAETMFGLPEGFDIVIGNPPYKDYRKIDATSKTALLKYRIANHSKVLNLYTYFFELGIALLSPKGILSYISPQQYLIYPNCKGLRDLFRECDLLLLADFARVKVFDAATYTFVTVISKQEPQSVAQYVEFNQVENLDAPLRSLEIANPIPEPVNISDFDEITSKIVANATVQLGEIATVFCASSSTTLELSTEEGFGPQLLTASDIHAWRIRKPQKRVKLSTYGVPSAKKQVGRIIYTSRMTKTIRAVALEDNDILGGKVNVVVAHEPEMTDLLVGLLNSKLLTFWYREKYSMQHLQGGALPVNTTELRELPLVLNGGHADAVAELSARAATLEGEELKECIEEIDRLIFDLYDLSEEDRSIILERSENY